ncbi:MAG TPA: O-antigen ligase family protein [Candidatus Dormibacteraeota bacterium]|nr:O-antigen ligase family protein [Candidatus Dormibacteraeota bacterium]
MYPSPILAVEAVLAILLVSGILCARPEYGLFLYGLALGFPDIAIPLGTAIHIRMDDALMVLFLIRCVLWTPAPLVPHQRRILGWQGIFLVVCFFSAAVEFAKGTPPAAYETAKMTGCTAIIFVLPRLVQSERRLRFLVAGLMFGGIALAMQILQRLGGGVENASANFQELKSAAAFTTWNPNTIGQAAMLLVFAAGLGAIVFPRWQGTRIFWLCLAMGFAGIPAMLYVRGTSLSIFAGFVVYLCLSRQWKWTIVFLAVCLSAVLILRATNRAMFDGAIRVNVASGAGFSHRYDRWDAAIEAIRAKPFLGRGFGREWIYLSGAGSDGRAHDAYLSVWIELGVGGLALLLAVVSQFVAVGLSLYRTPRFRLHGALLLALIFAICIDSFALPTLYWEKLPVIALSIGVALVGICERNLAERVFQEIRAPGMEAVPQHS